MTLAEKCRLVAYYGDISAANRRRWLKHGGSRMLTALLVDQVPIPSSILDISAAAREVLAVTGLPEIHSVKRGATPTLQDEPEVVPPEQEE